jgi:hypothetical protein
MVFCEPEVVFGNTVARYNQTLQGVTHERIKQPSTPALHC